MPQEKIKKTGCCDPIDPKKWDRKTINWRKKLFVRDRITSFFHIPLNMGSKITKNCNLIKKAGAKAKKQLMLSDENSLWGSDIYIDVIKQVPGAKMDRITGKFMTRVFEGPYKVAPKWASEMKAYVKSKGKKTEKILFFYTTCPKCAKAYKKNYVVLFAKVS